MHLLLTSSFLLWLHSACRYGQKSSLTHDEEMLITAQADGQGKGLKGLSRTSLAFFDPFFMFVSTSPLRGMGFFWQKVGRKSLYVSTS